MKFSRTAKTRVTTTLQRPMAVLSVVVLTACSSGSDVGSDAQVQTVFSALDATSVMRGVESASIRLSLIDATLSVLALAPAASFEPKDTRTSACGDRFGTPDPQCSGSIIEQASFALAEPQSAFAQGDYYSSTYSNYQHIGFRDGVIVDDELRLDFLSQFVNTTPYAGTVKLTYESTRPTTVNVDETYRLSDFTIARANAGQTLNGVAEPLRVASARYIYENWAYGRGAVDRVGSYVELRGPLFTGGSATGSVRATVTAVAADKTTLTVVARANDNAKKAETTIYSRRDADGRVTFRSF